MSDKFLGIGLTNALGLWLLFIVFSLVAKTVVQKYPIDGVKEIVNVGA